MEKRGYHLSNLSVGKKVIFGKTHVLREIPQYSKLIYNDKSNFHQNQVHDLLFKPEIRWQEIIYDLINTEELDPWDINLVVLTEKYLQIIEELESDDFFVSSQVLLAASLLLRIKSEILLNQYIKSIDDILFGRKEREKKVLERIELEGEIPDLIPRSPMPRFKKVTLNELIESLNHAITTENRRIKKEIIKKNALRETSISLPKRKFSIKDKIQELYVRLSSHMEKNSDKNKMTYTDLVGESKEEKTMSFYPVLQLENNSKVWLEQENHFEEIHVWLKKTYLKHHGDPFKDLKEELEREMAELNDKQKRRVRKVNKDFENPIGEGI